MTATTRLLPEGIYAVNMSGNRFIQYDPSECDPKLLKKHLVYFSDKRLEGLAVPKSEVVLLAEFLGVSNRHIMNQFIAPSAMELLTNALAAGELDRLFSTTGLPSSTAHVPGALITREAVQAEIDALRSRFGVEQEVPARFVERMSDIPGRESRDAAFGFTGLAFLPEPNSMEIVFGDEYLTYAKPYRDYLLLHEFAHCLQVLDAWPYYGGGDDHDTDSYRNACAKLGINPTEEGGYYPAGSYRIICQSCGDAKYAKERETLEVHGVTMAEFTRAFLCPHCRGKIEAEQIDLPVFTIGDKAYEVSPSGDPKVIGEIKRLY